MYIIFKKLVDTAIIPEYKTSGASGMDVCSIEQKYIYKQSHEIISTGLCVEIPEGYEIQVRPRSGLAAKYGITVLNTPGTIDSDYRGEIKIILLNTSQLDYSLNVGERIAQLVVVKVEQANILISDNLSKTKRDVGGFGHTGK
jgi:dUTP pyrophosphatase